MKSKRAARSSRASTLIELAITLPLLVLVSCVGVDIILFAYGAAANNQAARDAARAAGQRDNFDAALKAAVAAAGCHHYLGKTPTLDQASFEYETFGGDPSKDPYVKVTMRLKVDLPFKLKLYNVTLADSTVYQDTAVFPITASVPPNLK